MAQDTRKKPALPADRTAAGSDETLHQTLNTRRRNPLAPLLRVLDSRQPAGTRAMG